MTIIDKRPDTKIAKSTRPFRKKRCVVCGVSFHTRDNKVDTCGNCQSKASAAASSTNVVDVAVKEIVRDVTPSKNTVVKTTVAPVPTTVEPTTPPKTKGSNNAPIT